MKRRPTLRDALSEESPLITPAAHDALSARMIERAGFRAMAIGGSALLAARYALPDLGIAALGEMESGAREILAANRLPCLMDGDDGYGDAKSVVHMMHSYEAMGVSGVILEDQLRAGKQPGDSAAVGLASVEEMSEKLRAALATREDPEFMIIARCDAYGPEGLDGAMRRAERYLATGVDGAFLPGLSRPEELRQVGEAFGDKHLMTVMVQGSPIWTAPRELGEMGFSQIVYPGHMMTRMVETLDRALADLREYGNGAGDLPDQAGAGRARETLADVLRNEFWSRAGN